MNDAFFRFVVEMGGPELDKRKGGKYLRAMILLRCTALDRTRLAAGRLFA